MDSHPYRGGIHMSHSLENRKHRFSLFGPENVVIFKAGLPSMIGWFRNSAWSRGQRGISRCDMHDPAKSEAWYTQALP